MCLQYGPIYQHLVMQQQQSSSNNTEYKGSRTTISRKFSSACLSLSDNILVSFSASRSWRRALRSSLKARSHRSCSSSHRIRPLQPKDRRFKLHCQCITDFYCIVLDGAPDLPQQAALHVVCSPFWSKGQCILRSCHRVHVCQVWNW